MCSTSRPAEIGLCIRTVGGRAIGTGQRAEEDDVGSAALAANLVLGLLFLCCLTPSRRLLLEAIDHRPEILLRDSRTVGNNNVLLESAVRTFQPLIFDVEDQLRAALLAGEDAATARIDGPPFGLGDSDS